MIPKGSRYEGVSITGILHTDGSERKFLHERRVFTLEDAGQDTVEYEVKGQETIDSIASQKQIFNDSSLWWLICDVNDIFFFFDIEPGQKLIIPDASIRERTTQ